MKFPFVALYLVANFLLASISYSQLPSFRSGLIDRQFGDSGIVTMGGAGPVERGPIAFFRLGNGSIVNIHRSMGVGIGMFRYLPNGTPDSGFGNKGFVLIPNTSELFPYAAEMQADGKILIAGTIFSQTRFDIFVAKVTADGVLDQSFGTNGFVFRDLSTESALSDDEPSAVAVLAGGDVLVAGLAGVPSSGTPKPRQLFLMRLSNTGEPVESFGTSGVVLVPLGDGRVTPVGNVKLALSSNGNVLAGVSAALGDPTEFARTTRVYRFQSNGSPDLSFSDDGMVEIASENYYSGLYKIVELPDGKILSLSGPTQLTRLTANGSFDQSFGANGKRILTHFLPYDLFVLPTGKLLITGAAGVYPGERTGVVARYWSDGTPDIRFGRSGRTAFGRPGHDLSFGPILPAAGNFVLIGGAVRDVQNSPVMWQPTLSRMVLAK